MSKGIKRPLVLFVFILSISSPALNVKANELQINKKQAFEDKRLEDMNLLAQLVEAEAGNQDLIGKQYVVDVVLNRVDSEDFPNTVEEVIFQEDQFSVIKDGAFDRAYGNVSEESVEAVRLEYEERTNCDIIYFSTSKSKYAQNHFKCQDHWFGW